MALKKKKAVSSSDDGAWLPAVVKELVGETEREIRDIISQKMEEIQEGFDWLNEIVIEASQTMARTSPHIKQLPKTPTAKKKAQSRRAKRVIAETNDSADDEVAFVNMKPSTLTFDIAESGQDNQEPQPPPAKAGRSTRNTRLASPEPPKTRATRNSRKPVVKKAEPITPAAAECARSTPTLSLTKLPDMVEDGVGYRLESDESPCVKDRANAYEDMLIHRYSTSPVKTTKAQQTPNTPRRSRGKEASLDEESEDQQQSSKPKLSEKRTGSRASRKSSSSTRSQKSSLKKAKGSKLRLKKTDTPVRSVTKASKAKTISEGIVTDLNSSQSSQGPDMDETEMVVTEVFEIDNKGKTHLKEVDTVKTKTTPLQGLSAKSRISSDQGFTSGLNDDADDESTEDEEICTRSSSVKKNAKNERSSGPAITSSTRTRTRGQKQAAESSSGDDAGSDQASTSKVDSTFTKDSSPVQEQEPVRTTRTRARAVKKSSEVKSTEVENQSTEEGKDDSHNSSGQRSTRTRTRAANKTEEQTSGANEASSGTRTRTRVKKTEAEVIPVKEASKSRTAKVILSDDEILASSPVDRLKATKPPRPGGGVKKRVLEERGGQSPRPKRSRSIIGDPQNLSSKSPLSASSPIKNTGYDFNMSAQHLEEARDNVFTPSSPKRVNRIYNTFSSAQSKASSHSFLNRTPQFGNTSKLYTFNTTPNNSRSTSVLTSFLKRNTPTSKPSNQQIQEQKKQKLMEKEAKDKERLRKAAEVRKRRVEEAKRLREEKERKVAEARQARSRDDMDQKDRIAKKLEEKAALKAKLTEEREREEREKQKMRMKKQLEAETKRKLEEEERLRKLTEQEEEAKEQEEYMRRKKEHEELERKKRIEDEKRKEDERRAELVKKQQEEQLRLKKLNEEKERELERIRLEKERQLAAERNERERRERELKEERERKIKEELERLKEQEKERHQKALMEAKKNLQLQKENTKINNSAAVAKTASLNATRTLNSNSSENQQSYEISPVKKKVVTKNYNPDNYDIEDKVSDESTDDDEAPKKKIPEWAQGVHLRAALIRQCTNPPDVDALFRPDLIEGPDLEKIFPNVKKSRFNKRTSSAVWTTPPAKRLERF